MKKIFITGATGFIGRNLIERFRDRYEFLPYSRTTTDRELATMIREAEGCIHLAGVSRPQDPKEFYEGNSDLTRRIVDELLRQEKRIPLVFASSIHAVMDNDFGTSKRMAEAAILEYGTAGAKAFIIRLTNTFGRWAKPNAHSVVATFCYNLSHDIDIQISDPAREMHLAYVDDVADTILALLEGKNAPYVRESAPHYYEIIKTYPKTLGEIAETIQSCKEGRANMSDEFGKRMNETYQSYVNDVQIKT